MEKRAKIHEDLPSGYAVFYCESRGYDSPDRWHEVKYRGKTVREFNHTWRGRKDAIDFCFKHMCGRPL